VQQQWRKFEHFEKRVFAKATGVVTVSSLDAALARTHFGARRVAVVDNGVDTSFFQPDKATRQPRSILFLGSLDWRPNLDAARLLLEEIFPAVLAKESSAHLFLVGRNPPEWLKAWVRSAPNVELAGNVADVRPYLHRSSVMAVPLRVGGGSRLKILEALACGLPVVSTRVGAEGLCLETGRHLTVVQDVPDMAEALVKCLRDPFDAQSQAAAGRQRVLERYDWDILADRLEGIWRKWVAM
jgi:glycosyltransferase involved in cell wall biosynthesis